MDYQVIFDASKEAYNWWGGILGLSLIVFEVSMWKWRGRIPIKREIFPTFLVFCILLTSCLTITAFVESYGKYNDIQNIIRTGQYSVIEGSISNFQPGNVEGRKVESFVINNTLFSYNTADLSNPGFKNESGLRGILKNGTYARIRYVLDPERKQNIILKLEVKN